MGAPRWLSDTSRHPGPGTSEAAQSVALGPQDVTEVLFFSLPQESCCRKLGFFSFTQLFRVDRELSDLLICSHQAVTLSFQSLSVFRSWVLLARILKHQRGAKWPVGSQQVTGTPTQPGRRGGRAPPVRTKNHHHQLTGQRAEARSGGSQQRPPGGSQMVGRVPLRSPGGLC